MRILLIPAYLGRREPAVAPLGLISLAGNLSPLHTVKIFNPNVSLKPLEDTRNIIDDFSPDLIGISLRNIDTTKFSDQFCYFPHFIRYVEFIKSIKTECPLVVGGSGFSIFPREIMSRVKAIDFGFHLEAELTFSRFIDSDCLIDGLPGIYYRNKGDIIFTGEAPLPKWEDLKTPRWDLLTMNDYLPFSSKASIGVEAKRGCVFHCAYCVYPNLSGEELRMKSPGKVVEEIASLKTVFGVGRIFFCDPVFNYPLEHAISICQELLTKGVEIKWSGYHHERYITAEYLKFAIDSGCEELCFSPDSATDKGMNILCKGSNSRKLQKSLQIIAEDGRAKVAYNFFAAFPGSGWRDFFSAIWFLFKVKIRLGKRLIRYKFSYLRPEPGTPLAKIIYGEENPTCLLPRNRKELSKLFFRHSASPILNIFLHLHYHSGCIFGKKNTL